MEKVAIYCRLSEEDRNKKQETDDSNSIQNQKAMLLEYSIQQGWEVYNIYSDDNYTGSDRNRPEFKRLLDDAEAHKFDIVLCKSQSRFTRELELVEKYINGLFALSVWLTTLIRRTRATRNPVRSMVWSMNGIWRTCLKISVPFSPIAAKTAFISALLRSTATRKIRSKRDTSS